MRTPRSVPSTPRQQLSTPRSNRESQNRESLRLPRPLSASFDFMHLQAAPQDSLQRPSSDRGGLWSAGGRKEENLRPPSLPLSVPLPRINFLRSAKKSVDLISTGYELVDATPRKTDHSNNGAPYSARSSSADSGIDIAGTSSNSKTVSPFRPRSVRRVVGGAALAELASAGAKPDPQWVAMLQETRNDFDMDAEREAKYSRRMRNFSGKQISMARLEFNVLGMDGADSAEFGSQSRRSSSLESSPEPTEPIVV